MYSGKLTSYDSVFEQQPPSNHNGARVLKNPASRAPGGIPKSASDASIQAWEISPTTPGKPREDGVSVRSRVKTLGKVLAGVGIVVLIATIVLVTLIVVQSQSGNSADEVAAGYSDWSEWSVCSVTCDQGQQTRSRSCTDPESEHGGDQCNGSEEETQTCSATQECQFCEFYVISDEVGNGTIFTVSPNGTVNQLQVPVTNKAQGVVFDPAINTFFWTEQADKNVITDILLMKFDVGTNTATKLPFPEDLRRHTFYIANDPHDQFLFLLLTNPIYQVARVNYAGKDLAIIHVAHERVDGNRAGGIAVDAVGKYVYWTKQEAGASLQRSTYSGQDHAILLQGEGDGQVGVRPTVVVVDNDSDKIFWVLFFNAEIRSTPLGHPGVVTVEVIGYSNDGHGFGNNMVFCEGEFYIKRNNDYLCKWDNGKQRYVEFSDQKFITGKGQVAARRL